MKYLCVMLYCLLGNIYKFICIKLIWNAFNFKIKIKQIETKITESLN